MLHNIYISLCHSGEGPVAVGPLVYNYDLIFNASKAWFVYNCITFNDNNITFMFCVLNRFVLY